MSALELDELPQLRVIFRQLLGGYHISTEDFGLYGELAQREEGYRALFTRLGYRLVADPRGFYYFRAPAAGPAQVNNTTQRIAVLVFVLVEYLSDQGRDPDTLLRREPIHRAQLEAVLERHGELLEQAELGEMEAIDRLLQRMRNLGLATLSGERVLFHPPIARFLDVCLELTRAADAERRQDADAQGGQDAADQGDAR